jgi:hypothetical protein
MLENKCLVRWEYVVHLVNLAYQDFMAFKALQGNRVYLGDQVSEDCKGTQAIQALEDLSGMREKKAPQDHLEMME